MPELKPLPPDAIDAALEKAERYRLLNEAREAASICQDVLEVDPDNQHALTTLLLAMTDQFTREVGARVHDARELLPRIKGEYERVYYAGLICERWAKALVARGGPGAGANAHHWLEKALEWYGKANELRPASNHDAILRWNTCVRLMEQYEHVRPIHEDESPQLLE